MSEALPKFDPYPDLKAYEGGALPARVEVLTHEFFPKVGGIGTYVEEVASALVGLGTEVRVWAPAHPDLADRNFSFELRQIPVRGSQDWDCRIKLAMALKGGRALRSEATLWLPEPGPLRTWQYLQFLPEAVRRPTVLSFHGTELVHLSRTWHRRRLLRRLLSKVTRVGVVSNYVKDEFCRVYPDASEKCVVAPGAPRQSLLEMTHAEPDRAAGSGKAVLLTLGRVHPRKGQLAVVEALGQLPVSSRAEVEYRIAGPIVNSDYAETIEAAARDLGIALTYTGELSQAGVAEELRKATAFVMTSVPARSSVEGLGLVYLEAGIFNLPVIAHRIGGVGDAVKHDVTGLLVEPEDRAGLAVALARLLDSQEQRIAFGKCGAEYSRAFSWEKAARVQFQGLWS